MGQCHSARDGCAVLVAHETRSDNSHDITHTSTFRSQDYSSKNDDPTGEVRRIINEAEYNPNSSFRNNIPDEEEAISYGTVGPLISIGKVDAEEAKKSSNYF